MLSWTALYNTSEVISVCYELWDISAIICTSLFKKNTVHVFQETWTNLKVRILVPASLPRFTVAGIIGGISQNDDWNPKGQFFENLVIHIQWLSLYFVMWLILIFWRMIQCGRCVRKNPQFPYYRTARYAIGTRRDRTVCCCKIEVIASATFPSHLVLWNNYNAHLVWKWVFQIENLKFYQNLFVFKNVNIFKRHVWLLAEASDCWRRW